MGLQIGLAGLSGVLAGLAAARLPFAGRALGIVLAGFGLTTLPLVRRARAGQSGLALLVPLLVFARAWAQGLGVLVGLLRLAGERWGTADRHASRAAAGERSNGTLSDDDGHGAALDTSSVAVAGHQHGHASAESSTPVTASSSGTIPEPA
jgi:hypothetical protein